MTPPSNLDRPPLESAKRSIEIDMSPAAIDRRLREMDQLWELWRYLRRFKPVVDQKRRKSECGDI
jgi:hypothetical protein